MFNYLLMLCLLPALAYGMTLPQDELQRAPMPHVALSASGHMVKAHFAHLEGPTGKVANEEKPKFFRATMTEHCLKKGLKMPTKWPEFDGFYREDSYYSPNRTIIYTRSASYSFSTETCKVIDLPLIYTATLKSSKGVCMIDLIEKKAIGDCDPAIHATALPESRPHSSQNEYKALIHAQPGTPIGDALKTVLAMAPTSRGKKTILGLECEELLNPLIKMLSCAATGGSFRPTMSYGDGMLIELVPDEEHEGGIPSLRAVEAKLDTQVSDAIFSPHVSGGFTIRETGNHRKIEAIKNSVIRAK